MENENETPSTGGEEAEKTLETIHSPKASIGSKQDQENAEDNKSVKSGEDKTSQPGEEKTEPVESSDGVKEVEENLETEGSPGEDNNATDQQGKENPETEESPGEDNNATDQQGKENIEADESPSADANNEEKQGEEKQGEEKQGEEKQGEEKQDTEEALETKTEENVNTSETPESKPTENAEIPESLETNAPENIGAPENIDTSVNTDDQEPATPQDQEVGKAQESAEKTPAVENGEEASITPEIPTKIPDSKNDQPNAKEGLGASKPTRRVTADDNEDTFQGIFQSNRGVTQPSAKDVDKGTSNDIRPSIRAEPEGSRYGQTWIIAAVYIAFSTILMRFFMSTPRFLGAMVYVALVALLVLRYYGQGPLVPRRRRS